MPRLPVKHNNNVVSPHTVIFGADVSVAIKRNLVKNENIKEVYLMIWKI